MNVLVTGATGFIGSALVERLDREGLNVRALIREGNAYDCSSRVEKWYGELRDLKSIEDATKGIDCVCHCAAVGGRKSDQHEFYDTNVRGTENILKACVKNDVRRFVYASTILVAHPFPDRQIKEDVPYRNKGASAYADSKIDAEKLVLSYHREKKLPVFIIRLGMVYGPGKSWVVDELDFLLKSQKMILSGNGSNPANVIYIDNVIDALVKIIREKQTPSGIYNLSNDYDLTVREFLNLLADHMAVKRPARSIPYNWAKIIMKAFRIFEKLSGYSFFPLTRRYGFQQFAQNIRFDNSKIRETLGYTPKISSLAAISSFASWLGREKEVVRVRSGPDC